jgi:cell pole-organizing protein PopZ
LDFVRLEMALQDPQAEPSMEEILASIRRIISEEEQTPTAEPVLDLTQTDVPAAAAPVEDDIVFEAVDQAVIEETPVPEPAYAAPTPAPAPTPRAPAPTHHAVAHEPTIDTILSPPTTNAAAGALARLAGTLRVSDTAGQTVEGVVRELLKPTLKEWLDHNLPAIVEARVEAELERIARLAR